ncbi:MAG TPA: hypothetical protein DEB39_03825, partial [Planctomycetaceae bacterium]|nr:hypothetical protein [Planctomycetaceae bacterium]
GEQRPGAATGGTRTGAAADGATADSIVTDGVVTASSAITSSATTSSVTIAEPAQEGAARRSRLAARKAAGHRALQDDFFADFNGFGSVFTIEGGAEFDGSTGLGNGQRLSERQLRHKRERKQACQDN